MSESVIAFPADPEGASVYERLVAALRRGDIRPGARLMEVELAARFETSRTPVREALRRLEAEGLITHVPRAGATVRRLDYAEIVELYEMRAVIEGTAARLAARVASAVEIAALTEINHALRGARGSEAAALNRQFHRQMLEAARNRFLSRSAETLELTMSILGPSTLEDEARAEAAQAEHALVLEALVARDGAAAEMAMRAHLEGAQGQRLRQIGRGPG
ncbi:GntR family transcriptional regulator [Pseudooceanicola sp. C21-150M6]|uniref:GntR family transcriptional regulator n=1 Tax=Pseudooceanicola sp. C21-150M6 TaxID=3434355 RepID=UPI003D7F6064